MKIVVLLSGGMDSAVLAYHLLSLGYELKAISFQYGQKHARELDSASEISSRLGIEHRVVDLSSLKCLFGSSALTDSSIAVPHGHYSATNMKSTIVPNRNMIFLSIAAAFAISSEHSGVAFAAHAGDHFIYPDCRPAFVSAMQQSLCEGNDRDLKVVSPFLDWDKAKICARGAELNVPFALTWSCYEGGDLHCGECGTCQERKEAFRNSKVFDPTEYLK